MTGKAEFAKAQLLGFKDSVEKSLKVIFERELLESQDFTEYATAYITELRNLTSVGGKRLRGSFVYFTYKMFHGKDIEEIMKISAAIEILHAFLLVEDDFMDVSPVRRGYPTIHETYRKLHESSNFKKDSTHFGNTVAVNVGIIADHLALNVVTNSSFDQELIIRALKQINRQIIITGHGQIHDMLNEVRTGLTEKDIIDVLYWKTGIYTYDNPIQLGAIFAGATEYQLKILSEYAVPGGVAFQIQDDILGTFGDEKKTGKSSDGDIKEGKQTLLTYYAYLNGSKKDRSVIDAVLGDPNAKRSDIDELRKIMIKTGAYDQTKKKAEELVLEAKESLIKNDNGDWNKEGRDYLEGIADYMIYREL